MRLSIYLVLAFNLAAQTNLFNAICKVESNNNVLAVGDNGRALGIIQIHKTCWLDAKQFGHFGGQFTNCFDKSYSLGVFTNYLQKYEPQAIKDKNYEVLSKLWNGGPNWRKKGLQAQSNLAIYWRKVKEKL